MYPTSLPSHGIQLTIGSFHFGPRHPTAQPTAPLTALSRPLATPQTQELMNEKNRVEEANMTLGERMRAVQEQNEAYSSQNKRLEKELERLREQVCACVCMRVRACAEHVCGQSGGVGGARGVGCWGGGTFLCAWRSSSYSSRLFKTIYPPLPPPSGAAHRVRVGPAGSGQGWRVESSAGPAGGREQGCAR